jgi:hypothetical protein
MPRPEQTEIRARLVIEQPVPGVLHSLQQDDAPHDPKRSERGEPLSFDFPLRVADGPKFFGPFVRREGPMRRFVYVCIGTYAGDAESEWGRRMKIDIHDIDSGLLERAKQGGVLQGTFNGTAKDGSPACATIKPVIWRVV